MRVGLCVATLRFAESLRSYVNVWAVFTARLARFVNSAVLIIRLTISDEMRDVIDAEGRDISRIFMAGGRRPPDQPWMWAITGAVVAPRLPSHGFCATREEAKAKFAETWRAWPLLKAQETVTTGKQALENHAHWCDLACL
jgi:hypothetical protein